MDFLIATHNMKKREELHRILAPLGINVYLDFECGIILTEVEETGSTFAENALLKARAAFKETEKPSIADDSGLCVHALNNEPGVYTARYAEKMGGYEKAFKNLLTRTKEDRSAHFSCVIAYVDDKTEQIFEGRVDGILVEPQEGNEGFGFDPIFKPNGYDKTFACLPSDIKNTISHRARALQAFLAFIQRKS